MNRFARLLHRAAFPAAFLAGLATLGWIAAGYLGGRAGTHLLALVVTTLVTAFYLAGALELHRFRQATATLGDALAALAAPPATLAAWLGTLHPTLRQPVRGRVEGERHGLPGPVLTPFLAGLLVLLGMLGTFLGMVATLQGTGLALGQAGDLQALRAALSAPVQGLGLAFGTSVAGIAASGALGLMSALARRERLAASQRLDAALAGPLRAFSPAQQRDDSFALQQQQAAALPRLAERLEALLTTLAAQHQATGAQLAAQQQLGHTQWLQHQQQASGQLQQQHEQASAQLQQAQQQASALQQQTLQQVAEHLQQGHAQLARQLLQQQQDFHARADAAHAALAASVGQALQAHLAEGTRLAAATLQPVAEATLAGMARETAALHSRIAGTGQQQVEQLVAGFEARSAALVEQVGARLQASAEHSARHAAQLSQAVDEAHARLQATLAARDEQRQAAWAEALAAQARSLQQQWQAAAEHTTAQQQQITQALAEAAGQVSSQAEAHARATIAEIHQLVQAAAEAPRAAAEVVAQMRQQLSDSLVRDNTLLDERARVLGTLGTLLDAVNHAATEQRAAIDGLVDGAAGLLRQTGERFAERVEAGAAQLAGTAAALSGSAGQVAGLGEAFGQGVERFGHSNDRLLAQLERIEAALAQSLTRSDEQLAYYVAQAREVIELSMLSQQQIVQQLQQAVGAEA